VYPVALVVAAVSTPLAIVNVTAPGDPSLVAIAAESLMLIENAVLTAMAQEPPATVTVKIVPAPLATPVEAQLPASLAPEWMVTAMPDVSANTAEPAVTVIVPLTDTAPLGVVVAPNVIFVGLMPVLRSSETKVALSNWPTNVYPVALDVMVVSILDSIWNDTAPADASLVTRSV
jgi:hypothetical protein